MTLACQVIQWHTRIQIAQCMVICGCHTTINGYVTMWPHTQKDLKMYKVKGGISSGNNLGYEFSDITAAMDWADELHANGFYYAEVFDENRKCQYYVEDFKPRNQDERHERQKMAKAYIRKWAAKLIQDEAYAT